MRIGAGAKWIVFLAIIISVVLLAQCHTQPEPTPEKLTYLNLSDTVKYVGIETCKQCHYSIYQTFIKTGMGSSFGPADTTKSVAQIDGHSFLYDQYHNLHYHPYWKGDSLHVNEFRVNGKDTTYHQDITVDYVVGSGQHTNSHMYEENGYLFQVPFTWYAQKKELDFPPGFADGANTRFSRKIGLECTSCHNSMPLGFVKGSVNKYKIVPGAVNCERCHGPGSLHVKRMLRGDYVDTATQIDYSIVNIKKLPLDLQFEVCQRCHLQGNSVVAEGKSFFDFKPGMKLNSVMDVYLPRYSNTDNKFIMASHIDRLQQSQCYIQSHKKINCITCHNPHVSVRFTDKRQFNSACQNCHKGSPKYECREELSKLQAADFNCVGCHMPKSTSIDIPHVTVHDHKIKIPGKERIDSTGEKRFLGLVAVNNPSPTVRSKALAYLQQYERFAEVPYYLDSAAYFLHKMGPEKNHPKLWIYYYFLKKDYPALIGYVNHTGTQKLLDSLRQTTYDNDDAWAAYRTGEAFFTSQPGIALKFYKKAIDLAPYIPDFMNKYATALVATGNIEGGIAMYKKALKEQPNHKEALNNLGYTYLRQGKPELAEIYLDKSLAQDPDYEQVWLNLASLYIYRENKTEALKAIRQVLRINPNNEKARAALDFL